MKAFKKILLAAVAASLLSSPVKADEGMWMLPLLQKMNIKPMKALGCKLSAKDIYSINHSSLKDAIVHFGGGCTGEVISGEGLLVTNHHCGYGSIQALSSPEHNYLEDGFWAMSRAEEIPAPGLTVTFLESLTEVTSVLSKAQEEGPAALREARTKLLADARADNPGCEVTITGFYNDNVYYLIVYKVYRDIRFVGAPPASVGKFGGETDNWMWPRHTGDFSMFRIYAGPDNNPAAYSEDNVPYRPKKALKVSLKGVREGDFAFVMGYPGRTQRFQTAAQLESMINNYMVSVGARTVRQEVMWRGMEADPKVRLQYASKYASSANGWKKWQGEKLAFEKLNIIGREKDKEAAFMKWVEADSARVSKYGSALETIEGIVARSSKPGMETTLAIETLFRIGPVGIARSFSRAFQGALKENQDSLAASKAAFKAVGGDFKDYNVPLEKEIAVAMLEYYRSNAPRENYPKIAGEDFSTMDFRSYVEALFAESAFADPGNFARAEAAAKWSSDDKAMALQGEVMRIITSLMMKAGAERESLSAASKAFAGGLLEYQAGKPSYPDANSTMRLTYGKVGGYSPKDGVWYKHYTTLDGVMEKEDPSNYEFRVPARLKELWAAKDFGQYANSRGELPTCFLTNNDITGGNSGSPVLNARGELIGLAFDGNWESMSSDVMFEPDLQRCICVDIRYVLFMMDKVGGAGHLLAEMNIVK